MQDRIGAVVDVAEGVEPGRPDGPRRGGAESSSVGSSLGRSVLLELCLGKEGAETCKVLETFLTMVSTESSSFCKKSFGKTICAPKTASAKERPVSSLGCALSPRSIKSNSSDHVAAAAHARP